MAEYDTIPNFVLACIIVASLLLPSKRILQRSAFVLGGIILALACMFSISNFWWEQFWLAADLTVHSTFSTSYPALLRDLSVGVVVLWRLFKKEGMTAVRERFRASLDALVVVAGAFLLTLGYHLVVTIPHEINRSAESVAFSFRSTPNVPPLWLTKSARLVQLRQQPHVHLIFKDSPFLTPERQAHISAIIDSVYQYLTGVGFTLPNDAPPIGTRPGSSIAFSGIIPGSIYETHLSLPEMKIDDPQTIRSLYSMWVFQFVVFGAVPSPETTFNFQLSMLYYCYYISSFADHKLCAMADKKWVDALWEIRETQGKRATDRALVYAIKAWDHTETKNFKNDFDAFFVAQLSNGIQVEDNDMKRYVAVRSILQKRGLLKRTG